MRVQLGTLLKVVTYVVVTGMLIALVGAIFSRTRIESSREFSAVFSDASGLTSGVDVRASGVAVGSVKSVKLHKDGVIVRFTVTADVPLTSTTNARIRYANLTGDRYLDLTPGQTPGTALSPGSTIPLNRTQPALDLDTLFAGFDPLMQALDPAEVNKLTANIIAVTQGQSGSIEAMLANIGSFTAGLADRDQLIGDVVTHMAAALTTIDSKRSQFDHLILGLDKLMAGLSKDRRQIGASIASISTLAGDITVLLRRIRPDFKANVDQIGTVSKQLNLQQAKFREVLDLFPATIQRLGRGGAYGSFFNFFVCSMQMRVSLPGVPTYNGAPNVSDADRCKFPEDR